MRLLDGIRILDFTQHQAGPYGAALLADFGADVVKIERPGGDPGRGSFPDVEGLNPFFQTNNRNKRGLCLDLAKPEAIAVVERLVDRADVLVHNLKPGSMDKLGLGAARLRVRNPRLVYAALSTFGPKGPKRNATGVDLIGQAESGIMSVTGPENGDALPVGTALADALGGVNLALAMSLALLARERTGVGQEIHVSLVGGLMGVQAWEIQHHLLSGIVPPRGGHSHPQIRTIWTSFAAADGDFVVAEVKDSWAGICRAVDKPELAADERFRSIGRRYKNREVLRELLASVFRERSVEMNVSRLRTEGVMAAPVKDYAALAADEGVRANGYVRTFEHPTRGTMNVSGPYLHFSDTPPTIERLAPALGEHGDEVLREAGFADDEIAALRGAGVLG